MIIVLSEMAYPAASEDAAEAAAGRRGGRREA